MAKLIVSLCVGAIFWTIALSGLGLLQQIDCLENDWKLFKKLNANWEVKDLDQMLEAVDDKDNVGLAGKSVSELLSLKNNSNVDCQFNEIKKSDCHMGVYWYRGPTFNQGLRTFCQHYYTKRLEMCLNKMVEKLDAEVETQLNAATKDNLEEFFSHLPEFKVFDEFSIQKELVEWALSLDEANKSQIRVSCGKLTQSVAIGMRGSGENWLHYLMSLRGEEMSLGWFNIELACQRFVDFLKRESKLSGVTYDDDDDDDDDED